MRKEWRTGADENASATKQVLGGVLSALKYSVRGEIRCSCSPTYIQFTFSLKNGRYEIMQFACAG